jgi:hypothetical protein
MVGDVPKALAHMELATTTAERFGLAPVMRFSRGQLPGYYAASAGGRRGSSWRIW